MLFLSAQPDSPYFVWQLEVQLSNFNSFGIEADDIHILVGYDPLKGINGCFQDFSATHASLARLFFYPDTRISRNYTPSIRPHIIKQHFLKYPELSCTPIFYHDADIVFTSRLPDFATLLKDDIWYYSDTRSYLDSQFIKGRGETIFKEMCEVLDIDPKLVEENDANAGGAQTLLKNVDYLFWERIEEDSERLYSHLQTNKDRYKESYLKANAGYETEYRPIQSWCSDMWAILWNGLKRATIRLSPELDFCWPHELANLWNEKAIFHNAGVTSHTSRQYFFKSYFTNKTPYEEDFSFVSENCLSHKYIQQIKAVAENRRYNFKDVTFTITARIDSNDRLDNLLTALRFITTYFDTTILLLEADSERKVPREKIPEGVQYLFIKDERKIYLRQPYNNYLLRIASTRIVVKYDLDIIVPPSQMNDAVNAIRFGKSRISYPYDGVFVNVKGALRSHFIKTLDVKIFWQYLPIVPHSQPSYGGCVILEKNTFLEMGVDNEAFNGWGFEDQETPKRAKILGYAVHRADGPVFHLHHPRGLHSFFYDHDETLSSYREYVKVCNMTNADLKKYTDNWKKKQIYVGKD